MFNTQDRVRLWNRLVFTNGYFRKMSNSKQYNRGDLKNLYNQYVEENILREEADLLAQKKADLEE